MTRSAPDMPEEYFGKVTGNCGYTKSDPRTWTAEELEWCASLNEQGYTIEEIAQSVKRTTVAVSVKMKRLQKKSMAYAGGHLTEKYDINQMYLMLVRPGSVLDLYAGKSSFYAGRVAELVTNDKQYPAGNTYGMDALKCLCKIYSSGQTFDVVDLDPFGSAYDCFDLAIKTARKGLIITFGELGHKRFGRFDFVGTHYGIMRKEDFTLETMIEHVQQIGLKNKKKLVPLFVREWRNIGRVWFQIEEVKVTQQWEKGESA